MTMDAAQKSRLEDYCRLVLMHVLLLLGMRHLENHVAVNCSPITDDYTSNQHDLTGGGNTNYSLVYSAFTDIIQTEADVTLLQINTTRRISGSTSGMTTTTPTSSPLYDVTLTSAVRGRGRQQLCDVDLAARVARCDAGRIQQLPVVDLPDNITRLVVARGSISVGGQFLGRVLNVNNFTRLYNLERLTINNFGLSALQNSTFAALPHLEYLDLSWNSIQGLHDVTFVGLSKLQMLNLSHNAIAVIQLEFFNPLPSLKHLVLGYNHFTALPDGAFKLLPELQTLTLDGNDLGDGGLRSGAAFLGLDHLRQLSLADCNLHKITHSFFDHTQSVDTLRLGHNALTEVPTEALHQLFFLQVLDVSFNKFSGTLPANALQGLTLRVLDLSNNSLSAIAKKAFHLFRTEELYLRNNFLHGVPSQALKAFARHLYVLDLSGNRLEQEQVIFSDDLTYLHTLNLSFSSITHIPYSLRHLYQLHTLDVSNNFIAGMNESGTRLLRRLESVDLRGNPWNCDCSIAHLHQWLEQRPKSVRINRGESNSSPEQQSGNEQFDEQVVELPGVNVSSLICSRPDALSGTAVLDVPAGHLSHCLSPSPLWGTAPIAIAVLCGLAVIGLIALLIFMWRKRYDMGYAGGFCGAKGGDDDDIVASEPRSPIKVISNAGAGAEELPTRHQMMYAGPIKNQAWESALVISNPHSSHSGSGNPHNQSSSTGSGSSNGYHSSRSHQYQKPNGGMANESNGSIIDNNGGIHSTGTIVIKEANGKVPGAETIV